MSPITLTRTCLAAAAALTLAAVGFTTAGADAAAPPRAKVTKVVTFVVENHSLHQMQTSMPFVYGLAKRYAYADNYTAVAHPSLPNYLAIASGSTQGVRDDRSPSAHRLGATTVFDQALARHRTAKIYADSMTSRCQLGDRGKYAVRHNPWAYFTHSRTRCGRFDVPVSALAADSTAGRLPNVSMVIPNLVHDAHDASLGASDGWIKAQVQHLQAGPDWRSGRLAIVITADEDDKSSGNRVLTVVASRDQRHLVTHTSLNHYSLTRLLESVTGARYLGNAARAHSMKAAFGINTPYGS